MFQNVAVSNGNDFRDHLIFHIEKQRPGRVGASIKRTASELQSPDWNAGVGVGGRGRGWVLAGVCSSLRRRLLAGAGG